MRTASASSGNLLLRDATLREGLDTPGVHLDLGARLEILGLLAEAGIREAEIVAPGTFWSDLEVAREAKRRRLPLPVSGLVFAHGAEAADQIEAARTCLDRVDILMPVAGSRGPSRLADKIARLREVLEGAVGRGPGIGVGFPHALQEPWEDVVEIAAAAVGGGAQRLIVYDTNGACDPFTVYNRVRRVRAALPVPVVFHGHNDLGMATANSWAAVRAGAAGLDVTVNGLGDRAGNASLEQLAVLLRRSGRETGVDLARLPRLCREVAARTGVEVPPLAPVVGEFVFRHKSPGHLQCPELFEAFDPGWVGSARELVGPERGDRGGAGGASEPNGRGGRGVGGKP
jgi:homocitrate synthase NifV